VRAGNQLSAPVQGSGSPLCPLHSSSSVNGKGKKKGKKKGGKGERKKRRGRRTRKCEAGCEKPSLLLAIPQGEKKKREEKGKEESETTKHPSAEF